MRMVETHLCASLIVLRRLPDRSRQASTLVAFPELMRPPAARSWDPNPPLPPRTRTQRSSAMGWDGAKA